ncbi:MAG: UDP-3-O-(3-hydroxymyristoyl)glucosamine N-acyltransferase [Candidatus Methylacidiphilales bacterium]|nr:UDP-3-O-(3-hydroxymyristoyl)glucosamine N-acyltransferase [Candidatus Methylacidiphilales bacterium]
MKLSELAKALGGQFDGAEDPDILSVAGVAFAQPGQLTFLSSPSYLPQLKETAASAVLVKQLLPEISIPQVVVANPSSAATKATHVLGMKRPTPKAGISGKASISASATIGKGVTIMDFAVVEDDAQIGAGTVLYPGVYVGPNSKIGAECLVYPNVSILDGTLIGDRVIIHSGSVLGSDGFGVDLAGAEPSKVPQLGIVEVQDDVEIGACVTIDRARFDRTIIGKGTKIDNQVQIAHNVRVGENCVLVAQVGVAGSTELGKNVVLAAKVGVNSHIKVADNVMVAATSAIKASIPNSGPYGGIPAVPLNEWHRQMGNISNLGKMRKKLQDVMSRVEILERLLLHTPIPVEDQGDAGNYS